MSAPQETTRSMTTNIVIGIAILVGVAWGTSIWWLPPIGGTADDEPQTAAGSGEPLTMLELSAEALATLNIEVQPLKRTSYERTISVPGRTAVVPGVGRREVTSPTSGVVAGIFVREGEIVPPGQPLFEITLVHDEGIKVQIELLDALADRVVVDADLKRLQEVESRNPGVIQGTRILEKKYRQQQLNQLIESRKQMLILLGLPAADVDRLIESHLIGKGDSSRVANTESRESRLLSKVTVSAPSVNSNMDMNEPFLVEKLHVVQGQHVESGDVLCQLGDYRQLHIVGEAFERDSDAIRQARDKRWPVSVVIERRGGDPQVLRDLHIADIAPQVDAAARTAGFYVVLNNRIDEVPASDGQPARRDWVYRPGRRMEIRVPTERIPNALKVPVTAVAQDGLDNYVFQANGNIFNRRRVKVLHRDEDYVVLAESRMLTDGVPIAMNGAYQLQLALLNASMDPAAIAHGHAH